MGNNKSSRCARTWCWIGKPQFLVGCLFGLRSSGVILSFEATALSPESRLAVNHWLAQRLPLVDSSDTSLLEATDSPGHAIQTHNDWLETIGVFLNILHRMQRFAQIPVYELGKVLYFKNPNQACVIIPSNRTSAAALIESAGWLLDLIAQESQRQHHPAGKSTMEQGLETVLQHLRNSIKVSSNIPRFIRAAQELGIPFLDLPGQIFQYGLGANSVWLDSSYTDKTPLIAATLSRNKVLAAAILRQHGLPVPRHQRVSCEAEALSTADELGYPVVVKPADLDGGIGVAAGLRTAQELTTAYHKACQHSNNILIEKHAPGRDYRVTVFQDKVIWAIERVPGGVTGDGKSTVGELLNQLNSDPQRSAGPHAPLKRLVLDDESEQLLLAQALKRDSVPELGRFVRLRRIANVACGGTPVAVPDRLHPDNANLAIRAAQALRLDLAGIDILIPDISISWHHSGAAICEVNGQPNLGQTTSAHLYQLILRRLVDDDGRVPIILMLGTEKEDGLSHALVQALEATGARVGISGDQGVSVAGERIHNQGIQPYTGGRMLALNRQVDVIVIGVNDDSFLQTGLPMSCYDILVLAGSRVRFSPLTAGENCNQRLNNLLAGILPACDGFVLKTKTSGMITEKMQKQTRAQWQEIDGDTEQQSNTIVQILQRCELERRQSFAQRVEAPPHSSIVNN